VTNENRESSAATFDHGFAASIWSSNARQNFPISPSVCSAGNRAKSLHRPAVLTRRFEADEAVNHLSLLIRETERFRRENEHCEREPAVHKRLSGETGSNRRDCRPEREVPFAPKKRDQKRKNARESSLTCGR
jgi:hypothetical protein